MDLLVQWWEFALFYTGMGVVYGRHIADFTTDTKPRWLRDPGFSPRAAKWCAVTAVVAAYPLWPLVALTWLGGLPRQIREIMR